MTEEQKNDLVKKLIPIQTKIYKITRVMDELAFKAKVNKERYVQDSYNLILKPLNNLLKTQNCYVSFNEVQQKINIFKVRNNQKEKELISTVSFFNFSTNFSKSSSTPISIKVYNFSTSNFKLEEEEVDKFKIWLKVNSYLLKNEPTIVSKVNTLSKKHKNIESKLSKKYEPLLNNENSLKLKLSNLLYPFLLKDLKKGVDISSGLNYHHPNISIKNVSSIKQISDTELSFSSFPEYEFAPIKTYTLKIKDLQNQLKTNIFPSIINNITSPFIYPEIIKESLSGLFD